jgi:hypothetical protein
MLPSIARTILAPTLALATSLATTPVVGPRLKPDTSAAWEAYVSATERRIATEVRSRTGFLALDFRGSAAEDRRAVQAGGFVIAEMTTPGPAGSEVHVPSGMIHHWRGAVLLPGARLDQVLARLLKEVPGSGQDDILASAIKERQGDQLLVYLKVQRRRIVTVVYNTEHRVTFNRYSATRASSTSTAVRIAELDQPNTSSERELAAGEDHGFLWRWNSYWRYEQVPGGVIAECESISLSRGVPLGMGLIAAPFISSTARESMERALVAVRGHFAG